MSPAIFNFLVLLPRYNFYFQEKVYSGSHNAIHVWDATESFKLAAEIPHNYGSVYSLAVTKKYVIVGKYLLGFFYL